MHWTLTMSLVDDHNLIGEVDIERFSSVLLQQQVVRQCHKLNEIVSSDRATSTEVESKRQTTHLRLLDGSSCRIIRTHAAPRSLSHDVFDVFYAGLTRQPCFRSRSSQLDWRTNILSRASSIVPSSSFFGRNSHLSFPVGHQRS